MTQLKSEATIKFMADQIEAFKDFVLDSIAEGHHENFSDHLQFLRASMETFIDINDVDDVEPATIETMKQRIEQEKKTIRLGANDMQDVRTRFALIVSGNYYIGWNVSFYQYETKAYMASVLWKDDKHELVELDMRDL